MGLLHCRSKSSTCELFPKFFRENSQIYTKYLRILFDNNLPTDIANNWPHDKCTSPQINGDSFEAKKDILRKTHANSDKRQRQHVGFTKPSFNESKRIIFNARKSNPLKTNWTFLTILKQMFGLFLSFQAAFQGNNSLPFFISPLIWQSAKFNW